jgi:LPXTG-motif cell wall-anchored protein
MIPDTSTTSSTAVLAPTTTTAVIPTTGPSAASPPRSPELANTGGVAAASKILAGLAVLLLGAGLLFAARRSDPRRARDVSGS